MSKLIFLFDKLSFQERWCIITRLPNNLRVHKAHGNAVPVGLVWLVSGIVRLEEHGIATSWDKVGLCSRDTKDPIGHHNPCPGVKLIPVPSRNANLSTNANANGNGNTGLTWRTAMKIKYTLAILVVGLNSSHRNIGKKLYSLYLDVRTMFGENSVSCVCT